MASPVLRVVHERDREIMPGQHVGRVLPSPPLMHVGPFVFLDHAGPRQVAAGDGGDIPPHPHIGLATVSYLLEGELFHRDSVGSAQAIRPGAINWMTAARGIAHSERTPAAVRAKAHRVHLLQLWVGLPKALELEEPTFAHYPAEAIPTVQPSGVHARILAGTAWGATSPAITASPTLLVDARFGGANELRLPKAPELAALVIEGNVRCEDVDAHPGTMLVFAPDAAPLLRTTGPARLAVLGGEPLDGQRFIWWNFVSSSQERIVAAAHAWRERRWPTIPGDEAEFVPLDREPRFTRS